MKKEKQKVKCPKCGHAFFTKSKLQLVSCNGCGNKFKREENIAEELKNEKPKKRLSL